MKNDKPKKIEVWLAASGWFWHAVAGNGKILSDSGEGYARRNTAMRYMETVTDARRRNIPVLVTGKNGKEERIY